MPTYDPDTERWINNATNNVRPYAKADYQRGVLMLSAVTDTNGRISDIIIKDGFVLVHVINERLGPIPVSLRARFQNGRVAWSFHPDDRGDVDFVRSFTSFPTSQSHRFYQPDPWSERIEVTREGVEMVLIFGKSAGGAYPLKSVFSATLDRDVDFEDKGTTESADDKVLSPGAESGGCGLIIGIGGDLPATLRDAESVHRILTDATRACYSPSQLKLILAQGATRSEILAGLDQVRERASRHKELPVVVYYSGHGGYVETGDRRQYYLIPHGCDLARLEETAVSGAEFSSAIASIMSQKLIVFLDCCHAGGIAGTKSDSVHFKSAPMPLELAAMAQQGAGKVIIASSRDEEFSYTRGEISIFTECLLDAFDGKGKCRDDGWVRLFDMLQYLFDEVPKRAGTYSQHPLLARAQDLEADFPIVRVISKVHSEPKPSTKLGVGDEFRRTFHARDMEGLQATSILLQEKMQRMREDHAIQTSAAIKFQLEKELLRTEGELKELLEKITHAQKKLGEAGGAT